MPSSRGRHTTAATRRRRFPALLTGATVLGLWWGINAPQISPVAPPGPTSQVQPADATGEVPATPQAGTP
jgi:hypothetical protein